jgi:TQXA domain-containing protein
VTRRSVAAGSQVRWSDGTYSDTELVRLDEQLAAYAIVPGATGATGSTHHEVSWLDSDRLGDEGALTQVLAQGFGRVSVEELRRRLRRGGYLVAAEELTIPDAIAGTQAAVWHITTGRLLDPRHVNPLAVSHLYDYLLARAGVQGHGRREFSGPLGGRYFVAGVSAVEILGADVVDPDGRSLAGVVVPGQRFHLRGAGRRIMLRHGAVRARLLSDERNHLVTLTEQSPVVVEHILST